MKVLLTGGSGFIGRYVRAELASRGIEAVLAGRTAPAGSPQGFIACDLLDANDLGRTVRAAGASHLLHLAWYTEHGKFWEARENLRWLEATVRLVEQFNASGGQRVVIAGTCAEYDWSDGRCSEAGTPLNPTMLYGAAKDATRRLVEARCQQDGTALAWGRIFFNYGAGEPGSRLVPSLVAAMRGRTSPFGVDLRSRRDFLHATDIVRGFVTLLEASDIGSFNVSSGVATPVSKVVSTLARLIGADPKPFTALGSEKPGQPRIIVGLNAKLTGLGWRPQLSLEQGLGLIVNELS